MKNWKSSKSDGLLIFRKAIAVYSEGLHSPQSLFNDKVGGAWKLKEDTGELYRSLVLSRRS
jgi:hypothetical protein